jgi:RimJ/RimL family protein N-acetyltransferase
VNSRTVGDVLVRLLTPADAVAFQERRLEALRVAPTALAASVEEECDRTAAEIAAQLASRDDGGIVGAFNAAGDLVGMVGVQREQFKKLRHKGFVWGVYVTPSAQGGGVGTALLTFALDYARDTLGIRRINLSVNTQNRAAIALYEKLGFKTFGVEECYLVVDGVAYDELHMVCVL